MRPARYETDKIPGLDSKKRPRTVIRNAAIALGALISSAAPSLADPEYTDNADRVFEASADFTVATANVHSWKGIHGRSVRDGFKRFMIDSKPDILCGTEGLLGAKDFPSDFFADEDYTTITAPARLLPIKDGSGYGPFIATQYEVESFKVFDLPMSISLSDPAKFLRQRNAIYADLGDAGVICSHLDIDDADNVRQTQAILDFANEQDGPVIWLGDANNPSLFEDIEDANTPPQRSRDLFTFPAHNPILGIDIIRVLNAGEDTEVYYYQTMDIGSDHLAFSASVSL